MANLSLLQTEDTAGFYYQFCVTPVYNEAQNLLTKTMATIAPLALMSVCSHQDNETACDSRTSDDLHSAGSNGLSQSLRFEELFISHCMDVKIKMECGIH